MAAIDSVQRPQQPRLDSHDSSTNSYGDEKGSSDDTSDNDDNAVTTKDYADLNASTGQHVEDDTDADADPDLHEGDADASSLIGVSIGLDQNLMKSPSTPAVTKAQALERSATYFTAEPDGENHYFEEPSQLEVQEATSSDEQPDCANTSALGPTGQERKGDSPPSSSSDVCASVSAATSTTAAGASGAENKHRHEKRTSLVSSILGSSRKRSSSGSMLIDKVRRILPGLASVTPPESSATNNVKNEENNSGLRVLGPAGPATVRQNVSPSRGSQQQPVHNSLNRQNGSPDSANNADSRDSPAKGDAERPIPLRRATSDLSLYIRRAPTGASHFDDYSNFADVSDMTNSRFKAISDSLQDSAFHLPKIPSISRGERSSVASDAKTAHATIHNTRANAGVRRGGALEPHSNGQPQTHPDASSSRFPTMKSALSQMKGDLLIMGGYRGSILREASAPHRQLWVPVKVGLNLRKADLEVGLTREDELRMEETIIPDGTLSHIGPVDICRRLIRKCQRCSSSKDGKLRVHDYGYDWRLSPDLLTDRFIRYLESLPCNRKDLPPNERGAWVIAHSLGGLILRSAINQRPELFAGVVYAGTPQNCVNILGPLRNGDDVLFSSRVLTAQVNFTLRTSYALLPQNGRCFINKTTGEFYDLDFFDFKTWEEHCLSPCIRTVNHRHKVEKRRSLLAPSPEPLTKSGKHTSWFNNLSKDDLTDRSGKSPQQRIKDKALDTKNDISESADDAMVNKPGAPLSHSLADGQQQKPSIATQVTIPLPAATEYLTRTLASVLAFKKGLSHQPDLQSRNAYPPASVLFSKNTPTVYGAFVESREAIKYDDAFDDLAFAAGDGVVLASAAQLPAGYRCVRNGRVESVRGHVGLLGDIEGVGQCLMAVVDARRRGVGRGAHVTRKNSSALPIFQLSDSRIVL